MHTAKIRIQSKSPGNILIDMAVGIDQPGQYQPAATVDSFHVPGYIATLQPANGGDTSVAHKNVTNLINAVGGIDHTTAVQ
ncbi:hypothetical protein Q668_04715 [Alcanivorax sp. PN-3]|nr:hypothetical protein Q668_04715 [Alcanivorax sp. PN-3]